MDTKGSKTKLFLLEMVIILLFFAFAGAVCMNLFAKAKMISEQSTDLTQAMLQAQAAAEAVKTTGGDERELEKLIGGAPDEAGLIVYYDREWNPVKEKANSVYAMKIELGREAGTLDSSISVDKAGAMIYDLNVSQYDAD